MSNIVIVGAQWGDEGKGKVIDILSENADVIVRYQGGNNAGHTVALNRNEFIFHLIPSGILHREKVCVIASGVVIDPQALLEEIDSLKRKKVKIEGNLKISWGCHIIFPYHRILDRLRESRRKFRIGTTGRGIGPCYADKVARCGIRLADLLNPKMFSEKLKDNLKEKNEIFKRVYGHPGFSFEEIYAQYLRYGNRISRYGCDTALFLNRALSAGKSLLFEGAQGTFLDIDFGTYPFVTSSSACAGGACIGSGVSPVKIDKVIGVVKAYATRVGEGPFPTEFSPDLLVAIRNRGKEFGATTGRPRRCGWFDAVMASYAVKINGISELAVMKLDVLDKLEKILICVAYKYKGRVLRDFPMDLELLEKAKPVYEEHRGWMQDTKGIRRFDQLPLQAKRYLMRLQELSGAKINIISVGSKREETMFR
jgi:adenylosuccinate synthase